MQVKDKIVLVTGSNRGIGKALVAELLSRGVQKVYAAARNTNSLPDFGDDRVVPLQLDVTNKAHIKAATESASDIDMLINNAGVLYMANSLEGDVAQIENDMRVNYFGTLDMMRAFAPVLEKKGKAAIANVASIASFITFPDLDGYCASKAALYAITQSARITLAPKGIDVHSINPGPIDTDMAKDLHMDKTSTEVTAKNILDGIEANEPDIFPDDASKGMFSEWKNDYRAMEKAFAEEAKAA
ncbi:MAG: SDR family oxidoreductase [Rickettsiales bacterium]